MKRIIAAMLTIVMFAGLLTGCAKSKKAQNSYNLKEELRDCMLGNKITMGTYEQSNSKKDGVEPIEWVVIAKEDNKVLLLSDKILDYQKFDDSNDGVIWEKCSLRKWLNETFLETAFDDSLKSMIVLSSISNEVHFSYYDENPNDSSITTNDKIFLLSWDEIDEYNIYDRPVESTYATEYAQGLGTTGDWWTRDVTDEWRRYSASMVRERHGGGEKLPQDEYCGVRPAMWVSFD